MGCRRMRSRGFLIFPADTTSDASLNGPRNVDSSSTHWELGAAGREAGTFFTIEDIIAIYTAVTGLETSAEELHEVATRSYNLLKALNVREGFTRKDDKFPERWFEPVIRHGETVYLEDYFKKRLNPGRL